MKTNKSVLFTACTCLVICNAAAQSKEIIAKNADDFIANVARCANMPNDASDPQLEDDIREYGFSISELGLNKNWSFEVNKGWDETRTDETKFCIVVKVLDDAGNSKGYFRIRSYCPPRCGIQSVQVQAPEAVGNTKPVSIKQDTADRLLNSQGSTSVNYFLVDSVMVNQMIDDKAVYFHALLAGKRNIYVIGFHSVMILSELEKEGYPIGAVRKIGHKHLGIGR